MMFGRRHKMFTKPRKAYDKMRIEEENELVKVYGLKNKKEIWKADSSVTVLRNRAKSLIGKDPELQQKFIQKLRDMGFKVESISEVLALNKEDHLKRRLQSIVLEKRIATTAKQSRQMITHKRIMVNEKVVNIPSYLVKVDEEGKIAMKSRKQNGN